MALIPLHSCYVETLFVLAFATFFCFFINTVTVYYYTVLKLSFSFSLALSFWPYIIKLYHCCTVPLALTRVVLSLSLVLSFFAAQARVLQTPNQPTFLKLFASDHIEMYSLPFVNCTLFPYMNSQPVVHWSVKYCTCTSPLINIPNSYFHLHCENKPQRRSLISLIQYCSTRKKKNHSKPFQNNF